jgi:hypothetical protein
MTNELNTKQDLEATIENVKSAFRDIRAHLHNFIQYTFHIPEDDRLPNNPGTEYDHDWHSTSGIAQEIISLVNVSRRVMLGCRSTLASEWPYLESVTRHTLGYPDRSSIPVMPISMFT